MQEIEKTEKERIKKKGNLISMSILILTVILFLGLKLLKNSGILDAYQCNNHSLINCLDLLTSLCKYGLPTGDLYEFSAL
jgi:hypothetical protein